MKWSVNEGRAERSRRISEHVLAGDVDREFCGNWAHFAGDSMGVTRF